MRKIKLKTKTGIHCAIVDDDDYKRLSKHTWYGNMYKGNLRAIRVEVVNGKHKAFYMHREVLNVTDRLIIVDHRDGKPLNNQKYNLRKCTHAQNMRNKRPAKNSSSKYLGVTAKKNGFRAKVSHDGRTFNLGMFKCEIEAAKAYDRKAIELFGEFANPNFKNHE